MHRTKYKNIYRRKVKQKDNNSMSESSDIVRVQLRPNMDSNSISSSSRTSSSQHVMVRLLISKGLNVFATCYLYDYTHLYYNFDVI